MVRKMVSSPNRIERVTESTIRDRTRGFSKVRALILEVIPYSYFDWTDVWVPRMWVTMSMKVIPGLGFRLCEYEMP